jgi:hypothetical protein
MDANHEHCGCPENCLCRKEPPKYCAWHVVGRRLEEMADEYARTNYGDDLPK